MNPERWTQIKELFDRARKLPPNEQTAFLDTSCAADSSLREEVESLLKSYESGFLEEPLLPEVGDIVGDETGFEHGKVIGRYQIKELIGTGGMGQVFRADDTELDRPAAIKVLHQDVAEDDERVRRFIQEARAASALNHPNILTIYEIGTFEGSRFIVSEYVDGETLRERMAGGLTAAESLEITCQIAAALQAAHQAGIVHRDIKPENIMLRKDGLVKVLDFGLAKLTEADDLPIDANTSPLSRLQTSPGLIMGTVAYMSPEQASGQVVDSRTDLWSLGVVFHEMLTGESPFKGESVTDLVTSILKHDPASLDLKSISQELKPICTKALAKDLKTRYQSAQELLQDLQGEKKRMEYAIQGTPFVTVSNTNELKTQLIRRRPTLSAEYIVSSVRRHKYATLLTVAAVIVIGVGFSVYKYNPAPQPSGSNNSLAAVIGASTTEADLSVSRFTSSGKIAAVAISPDGKYIAYVTADGPEKNALRLRMRDGSKDAEIVPAPQTGGFSDISFSPDSSNIYYRHVFGPENTINKVAITGGTPTKIIINATSGGSLSPDGKMIAFNRDFDCKYGKGCGDDVFVADPDGTNERVLVRSPFDGPVWVNCGQVPAWSPDGKTLACSTTYNSDQGRYHRITYVNVADGSVRLRDEKWRDLSGAVYLPDGSLVVAGKLQSSEQLAPAQLWLVTANAPPKGITSDLTGYSTLSATRTGDVLMTIQNRTLLDLWAVRGNDISTMRQITNSCELFAGGGFDWTPDGKMLFISTVSGNAEVWMVNDDGTGRKRLTNIPGYKVRPKMSADGRYIVYMGSMNGWDSHVFRMNADGSDLKQLTSGWSERYPHISLDGKWVYFISIPEQDGPPSLRKISIDGGDPIELAVGARMIHDISRKDGSILYSPQSLGQLKSMKIMSSSDPSKIKTVAKPAQIVERGGKWSFDGRYLMLADRKNPAFHALQTVTLTGKMLPKPLITFPKGIGDFGWTKDGKQLGFISGTSTSEGVIITNKGN